jgi:hypothetical protein
MLAFRDVAGERLRTRLCESVDRASAVDPDLSASGNAVRKATSRGHTVRCVAAFRMVLMMKLVKELLYRFFDSLPLGLAAPASACRCARFGRGRCRGGGLRELGRYRAEEAGLEAAAERRPASCGHGVIVLKISASLVVGRRKRVRDRYRPWGAWRGYIRTRFSLHAACPMPDSSQV